MLLMLELLMLQELASVAPEARAACGARELLERPLLQMQWSAHVNTNAGVACCHIAARAAIRLL